MRRSRTRASILDYVFRELAISYLGRNDLAHIDPSEVGHDVLGKGEEQGKLQGGSGEFGRGQARLIGLRAR